MDRIPAEDCSYSQGKFLFDYGDYSAQPARLYATLAKRHPGTPLAFVSHYRLAFWHWGHGDAAKALGEFRDACQPPGGRRQTEIGSNTPAEDIWPRHADISDGTYNWGGENWVEDWRCGADFCIGACLKDLGRTEDAAAIWRRLTASRAGENMEWFPWVPLPTAVLPAPAMAARYPADRLLAAAAAVAGRHAERLSPPEPPHSAARMRGRLRACPPLRRGHLLSSHHERIGQDHQELSRTHPRPTATLGRRIPEPYAESYSGVGLFVQLLRRVTHVR